MTTEAEYAVDTAITESIKLDRIERLHPETRAEYEAVTAVLSYECSGDASGEEYEAWGARDGRPWRVHVAKP